MAQKGLPASLAGPFVAYVSGVTPLKGACWRKRSFAEGVSVRQQAPFGAGVYAHQKILYASVICHDLARWPKLPPLLLIWAMSDRLP